MPGFIGMDEGEPAAEEPDGVTRLTELTELTDLGEPGLAVGVRGPLPGMDGPVP